MKKKLLAVLGIEQGEEQKVFLLLIQSFFIGVFIATYENIAIPIFNEAFSGQESMESIGLMVSGGVGILFVTLYAKLQTTIKFSRLAFLNLFVVTLIVIGMSVGLEFTDNKWLKFTVFIMIGPLIVTSILGFWGAAGRLFNLRQGKRLFGLVDSGMIVGMIVISLVIPVIQSLFRNQKDILFISAVSSLVAAIVQLRVTTKFAAEINQENIEKKDSDKKSSTSSFSWGKLFKNPFTRSLSIFVTLSMVTAFFIWLSYIKVAKEVYTEETTLINFFFLFYAIVMVITLIMKTFLYNRVMKTYGLKITLLANIAIVLIFSVIAAVIGSFVSDVSVFFLIVALVRLLSQSLKYSIEGPAQKLFFQPLDRDIRYDVQAKVEGVVNEMAGIIAGALLFVIFQYFHLLLASYILVAIVAIWFYYGIKLYKEYQNTLQSSLDKSKGETIEFHEDKLGEAITHGINLETPEEQMNTLSLAGKLEPILYESSLKIMLENGDEKIQRFVLDKINDGVILSLESELQSYANKTQNEELKQIADEILSDFVKIRSAKKSVDEMRNSIRSRDTRKKLEVVRYIGLNHQDAHQEIIVELTRDIDPEVKMALIHEIARLNLTEFYSFLVDLLPNERYSSYASSALISLGEYALKPLESAFYRSGFDSNTLVNITKIYGVIGGEQAVSYLESKLNFPDQKVVVQVLQSLRACGYQAKDAVRNQIHSIIDSYIGNISWYMAAKDVLAEKEYAVEMLEALDQEIESSFNLLYLLLSLNYEPNAIKSIRDNLESDSSEQISYAIELLDLFIAEDVKPKLFPLVEDLPIDEKLAALQVHYPREKMTEQDIFIQILNRDYNLTSRWTKYMALTCLDKLKGFKVSKDVIAQLFNSDPLLFETSAWLIRKHDPVKFEECVLRIELGKRKNLLRNLDLHERGRLNLLRDKIEYLKGLIAFKNIETSLLSDVAGKLEKFGFEDGELIDELNSHDYTTFILIEGQVSVYGDGDQLKSTYQSGDVFGQIMSYDKAEKLKYVSVGNTDLYRIPNEELQDLLYNHPELFYYFIDLTAELVV